MMYPDPNLYKLYMPPEPPTKQSLSADLTQAIKQRNADAARKAFDTAFWKKIDLTPNWHHLLCAVALKDVAMVRLLTAHGAQWQENEARALKEIFPDKWPEFSATLRSGGLPTVVEGDAPADIFLRVQMARYIAEADQDIQPFIAIKEDTQRLLSDAIIKNLAAGNAKEAAALMLLRQPEGEVDISREMDILWLQKDFRRAALTLVNIRRMYDIGTKKIKIDPGIAAVRPEVIADLYHYNLLDEKTGRLHLVRCWLSATEEKDYQAYKAVTGLLFKSYRPPVAEEAAEFINLYREATANGDKNPSRVLADLKGMDFFEGGAWTGARLEGLNKLLDEKSSLRAVFNKKIAEERFSLMLDKDLLKPENLTAFFDAHKKGHYRADYSQISHLLKGLQDKYKDGYVPADIAEGLGHVKKAYPNFALSLIRANDFFGKREPGLAKILLDLDMLDPLDLHLSLLRHKAGLPKDAVTIYPAKDTGKYVEFFAQVYLEQTYPKEFIPQRGKTVSYSAELVKKNPPPAVAPRRFGFFH
jgi:hypothetical protein